MIRNLRTHPAEGVLNGPFIYTRSRRDRPARFSQGTLLLVELTAIGKRKAHGGGAMERGEQYALEFLIGEIWSRPGLDRTAERFVLRRMR